jgi:hypothetical protein
MNSYSLTHLSDAVLIRNLQIMLARDGVLTATLLAHIAEVDARRLYAPAGFSSMFMYCLRELRFSEDAAWRRIQAARAARRFPVLFQAVAEGRLHLTAVCLIAPHLTPANMDELLRAVEGRSRGEIQEWLATRFPQAASPPPLASIRPVALPAPKTAALDRRPDMFESSAPLDRGLASLPAPAHVKSVTTVAVNGHAPDAKQDADPAVPPGDPGHVELSKNHGSDPEPTADAVTGPTPGGGRMATGQLSPPSFVVQVIVSKMTHDKLRLAQALLSHAVSPRDVAQVLDRALDALIEKLEKRKFGAASRS